MKLEFNGKNLGIKLLPITISKIISTLFGIAFILNFGGAALLIYKRTSILLVSFLIMYVPFHIYIKNDPEGWSNSVTFDFSDRMIYKNNESLHFDSIKKVRAEQFEGFIFPTYYKIGLVDQNDRFIKLIAIRSPQDYSNILDHFSKSGVKING